MERRTTGYPSAADSRFLDTVAVWIAERGEILAMIPYSHNAGAKDFAFFASTEASRARLRQLTPRHRVAVFGRR